jgi:hypothetical protein
MRLGPAVHVVLGLALATVGYFALPDWFASRWWYFTHLYDTWRWVLIALPVPTAIGIAATLGRPKFGALRFSIAAIPFAVGIALAKWRVVQVGTFGDDFVTAEENPIWRARVVADWLGEQLWPAILGGFMTVGLAIGAAATAQNDLPRKKPRAVVWLVCVIALAIFQFFRGHGVAAFYAVFVGAALVPVLGSGRFSTVASSLLAVLVLDASLDLLAFAKGMIATTEEGFGMTERADALRHMLAVRRFDGVVAGLHLVLGLALLVREKSVPFDVTIPVVALIVFLFGLQQLRDAGRSLPTRTALNPIRNFVVIPDDAGTAEYVEEQWEPPPGRAAMDGPPMRPVYVIRDGTPLPRCSTYRLKSVVFWAERGVTMKEALSRFDEKCLLDIVYIARHDLPPSAEAELGELSAYLGAYGYLHFRSRDGGRVHDVHAADTLEDTLERIAESEKTNPLPREMKRQFHCLDCTP